jgi:hypothetical protein
VPPARPGGGTVEATLLTSLGIDGYLIHADASGTNHLLTDALGSTVVLTDGKGSLTTTYTVRAIRDD